MSTQKKFSIKNRNRRDYHKPGDRTCIESRRLRRLCNGAFGNLSKSEKEVLAIGTRKEGEF